MTDNELLAYSQEHLFYEIQMFLDVSKLNFGNILNKDIRKLLNNIKTESFVIHLRNLITFLYPTKSVSKTDVYAKNFFSNPDLWESTRPPISQTLENARNRAHKEMGHITTERISGINDPKKSWEIKQLTDEIVPILKLFCDSADKSKLDNNILRLFSLHYEN